MEYSAKFRYIDIEFGFDALDQGSWSTEYDNEDDFILSLSESYGYRDFAAFGGRVSRS